jgi:hypothetical protein
VDVGDGWVRALEAGCSCGRVIVVEALWGWLRRRMGVDGVRVGGVCLVFLDVGSEWERVIRVFICLELPSKRLEDGGICAFLFVISTRLAVRRAY